MSAANAVASTSIRARASTVALALALAAVAGCSDESDPEGRKRAADIASPPAATAKFAGSEKCRSCHTGEYSAWKASHHGNAMERYDPAAELGAGNAAALAKPGDGASASYSIGYDPLRQYLAAAGGGRFQVLPYALAAEHMQRKIKLEWFLIADRDGATGAWSSRRFNANRLCIECHTTEYRKGYDAVSDTYASRWRELGVGCESCHGPSAAHATVAERDAPERVHTSNPLPPRDAARWVFEDGRPTARKTPAHTPSPRVDTCARCHSLRDPIVPSPRAGLPLLDQYVPAVLDSNNYQLDGQIKQESYEYGAFLQSKMYAAGVGCEDCHEPHTGELRGRGNALCANCHRADVFDTPVHHRHENGTPGSQCTDCHMPERTFMRIDGRRDHGFKVPRPDLTLAYGVPNACNGCHARRTPEWAAAALAGDPAPPDDARAALARALAATDRGGDDAAALLAALAADSAAPAITRASALEALARIGEPVAAELFESSIGDPDPLVRAYAARLLTLAPATAQAAAARRLIDDDSAAVRHSAALGLAANAAASGVRQPGVDALLQEYLASLAPSFDDPAANVNAALVYTYRGEAEAAERRYLHALRLEPDDTSALVNLADLYRMTGRDTEALALLQRATASAPANAAAQYALALALQRSGDSEGALAAADRAARLAPEIADYPYAYALALQSAGRRQEALAVVDENLRRHPRHRASLLISASIYRDIGADDRARESARAMLALDPDDGFAQALLEELGAGAERTNRSADR